MQFYSLKYINLADSMVISFSTPVFVTLVAHLFLGEKCGIIPLISGIIVLGGVGVITRPPMLTGQEEFDMNNLVQNAIIGKTVRACISEIILVLVILQFLCRSEHLWLSQVWSSPPLLL
jgi:drug/metabolite transporter (DMT)-like permease